MKAMRLSCAALLSAIAVGGCAAVEHEVRVYPEYPEAHTAPDRVLPALRIGDIRDARDDSGARTIFGSWRSERDLALVVMDALSAGANHFNAGEAAAASPMVLEGEIVEISPGSAEGGSFALEIAVRLAVRDAQTGRIVKDALVVGRGVADAGVGEAFVQTAFGGALSDFVVTTFDQNGVLADLFRPAPSEWPFVCVDVPEVSYDYRGYPLNFTCVTEDGGSRLFAIGASQMPLLGFRTGYDNPVWMNAQLAHEMHNAEIVSTFVTAHAAAPDADIKLHIRYGEYVNPQRLNPRDPNPAFWIAHGLRLTVGP